MAEDGIPGDARTDRRPAARCAHACLKQWQENDRASCGRCDYGENWKRRFIRLAARPTSTPQGYRSELASRRDAGGSEPGRYCRPSRVSRPQADRPCLEPRLSRQHRGDVRIATLIESISISPSSMRYREPTLTCGLFQIRTLQVISPRRTPSRRRLVNTMERVYPSRRLEAVGRHGHVSHMFVCCKHVEDDSGQRRSGSDPRHPGRLGRPRRA